METFQLYLGSSIFHGHLEGISFVDMMREDYVRLELTGRTEYLLRNRAWESERGAAGERIYRCDERVLHILSHDRGRFCGQDVALRREGQALLLCAKDGEIGKIFFGTGDRNVIKKTANGASMAFFTPKQLLPDREYEQRSYWYRLMHGSQEVPSVDRLYLQLSTNDAAWAVSGDVRFGEVLPDDKREESDFDPTTTCGAMESMIAYAGRRWNCRVVLVVCPYINAEGAYSRLYTELTGTVPAVKRKWGIDVLDLYHDGELYRMITSDDETQKLRYQYPDRVHFTTLGYERWIWPRFRAYEDRCKREEESGNGRKE